MSIFTSYLIKSDYSVKILDAESENLNHNQTAERIVEINPKLAIFMIYKKTYFMLPFFYEILVIKYVFIY